MKSVKQTKRFEQALAQINEIRDMLDEEGKNDGKSRYLEVMAKLLLSIDESLSLLRGYLAFLIGLALALFIGSMLMGG